MQRVQVSSSHLASVGYDPTSQTLEIAFHSGSVYQFFVVPELLFSRLMSAPSPGTFFHEHIKDRFRYKQIK